MFSILSLLPAAALSTGFEFGLGSGFIFYGDEKIRDMDDSLGDKNQIIFSTDVAFMLPLNKTVMFTFGGDFNFDLHWHGGDHLNVIDYAFLMGVRAYPGLWGTFLSVDYALGRRSDFISIDNNEYVENTQWGNGFKISAGYDFSYHMKGFAPELVASFKSMPRGNSRDNILGLSIKFTNHE